MRSPMLDLERYLVKLERDWDAGVISDQTYDELATAAVLDYVRQCRQPYYAAMED